MTNTNHILLLVLYSKTPPADLRTLFAIASQAGHTLEDSMVSIVDNNFDRSPGVTFGPLTESDFVAAGITPGVIRTECTDKVLDPSDGKSAYAATTQHEANLQGHIAFAGAATGIAVSNIIVVDGSNPTEAGAYRHLIGLIAAAQPTKTEVKPKK